MDASMDIIEFLTNNEIAENDFREQFARITEYNPNANSKFTSAEEIKFINRVYSYGCNFNKIKVISMKGCIFADKIYTLNGCNFIYNFCLKIKDTTLPILKNKHLDYEKLIQFLSNDFANINLSFNIIKDSINAMVDPKTKRLAEYCFADNKFTPLTVQRLAYFEVKNADIIFDENSDYVQSQKEYKTNIINLADKCSKYLDFAPNAKFFAEYAELSSSEFTTIFAKMPHFCAEILFKSMDEQIKFIETTHEYGCNFKNVFAKYDKNSVSEFYDKRIDYIYEKIAEINLTDAIIDYYLDYVNAFNCGIYNIFENEKITFAQSIRVLSRDNADNYIKSYVDNILNNIKNKSKNKDVIEANLIKKLIQFCLKVNYIKDVEYYSHITLTPLRSAEFYNKYKFTLDGKKSVNIEEKNIEEINNKEKNIEEKITDAKNTINNLPADIKKKTILELLQTLL